MLTNGGTAPDIDQIENIAALTIHLHEWMFLDSDWGHDEWPRRYRYQAFNGISGWWCYLARCARVFTSLHFADDDFMEAMRCYADFVWRATFDRRGPLEDHELQLLLRRTVESVKQDAASPPWKDG